MVRQVTKVPLDKYIDLALSHARFTRNEDGSWTCEVSVLPGCVTCGRTKSKAVEMARDAVEAWVLTAIRFGDVVPEIDGCVLAYGQAEGDAPAHP